MDDRIMQQARFYEGNVQEQWELLGMRETRTFRLRYYRDENGDLWFTSQKLKRKDTEYAVRQDESGRIFAHPVYPKRKRKSRMA